MKVGSDAAPAGVVRSHALGRPRDPIGGQYDPSAGSLLDWDWPKGLVPGNADLGSRNRRDGAERRYVLATARDKVSMTRRLARHPLGFFEGRKACPRESGEEYGLPGAA
jgi:hypothetical protein